MLLKRALALALTGGASALGQMTGMPGMPAKPATSVAPLVAQSSLQSFVTNAPQHRAAVLSLKAGNPATNDGYNYNGATDGEKGFVVPLGWRIIINFYNIGTEPHSAIVVAQPPDGKVVEQYTVDDAAFPGASHRIVINGTGRYAGKLDFLANKAGKYFIVCGRAKHSMNGQYVTLEVSPTAKEASWQ